MKKLIISILVVIMLSTCVFAMVACNSGDAEVTIVSISGELTEDLELVVGDAYASTDFVLTALLSDESEVIITNTSALTYDKSGLSLDSDGCYEEGTQKIIITYLATPVTIEFTVEAE